MVRRARGLAPARRVRPGAAGLAARRQAAGGRHHHAAPDQDHQALIEDKNAIVTRGSTFDNRHHLAQAFIDRITARYAGRAIGRQELFAEIVEEAPGALWTRALIERQRLPPGFALADYREIVVGVDPPAKSGANADECGIVVVGKTATGEIYVLADLTSQGETPGQWAARVARAFRRFKANRVVVEINNGGDMVVAVLRQSDPHLAVRAVTATRGKFLRAEPVAAAYERGIVFHLGGFGALEDQLCALTPDFDARAAGFSPDRADALVWAVADLLGLDDGAKGMIDFYAGRGEGVRRRAAAFTGAAETRTRRPRAARGRACG